MAYRLDEMTTPQSSQPEYPPRNRDRDAEARELKRLREDVLKWSRDEAARMLDVSSQTYGRWERNERPCQWAALQLMRRWATEAAPKKRGR